jgi:hypothetical protein
MGLVDTTNVIEQAQEYLSPELRERIMSVPGNFFENVPIGADVYILKNILHQRGPIGDGHPRGLRRT